MLADEEKVAALWDANADQWVEIVRGRRDPFREFFIAPAFLDRFLPDVSGRRVIDLGCGEGIVSRILAAKGAHVLGVDISARMLNAAELLEEQEPQNIRYDLCSFADLTCVSDAVAEIAVSFMTLMDSPRLGDAMHEAFRVLVPSASIYIAVLHPLWLLATEAAQQARGGYWSSQPYIEKVEFPAEVGPSTFLPILRYPYRVGAYLNALSTAGFVIEKVIEPKPDRPVPSPNSGLFIQSQKFPMLLLISARKP